MKSIEKYYNSLGSPLEHSKVASYLKPLLGATLLGGLGGTIYGMADKSNAYRDPLHPATSTYGLIGLQSGLGLGAGLLARNALGSTGLLARAGLPLAGAGIGALLGLNRASANGRPDLRLKQPGIDYSFDPRLTSLKYLSEEAAKL